MVVVSNVSISMTMTDAVKCEMKNYEKSDNFMPDFSSI